MANWGIIKSDEDLFIVINGMRARNIKNGEEHGPIQHLDHGRNSDELWIHFRDEDGGKRLDRKLFKSYQGQFQELENAHTNSSFIEHLREHGVTKRRKTGRILNARRGVETPSSFEDIVGPASTVPSREFQSTKEKKIGTFKVKIERLQEAPEEFRCRSIDKEWVTEIKESIRQAPGDIVTKVPILIPLNVATDPCQFQEGMLDGPLYLIGGNHIIKACQELLEEEQDNEEFQGYRNISADVFMGLSPEQAKMIGNLHNRKTTTKTVLFQDQVLQTRSVYLRQLEEGEEETWKDTATLILSNLHERTYTKKGLNTVLSVASQEEEVFLQVTRIFELWNLRNSMKDFPQQIFRNMTNIEPSKICQYLRRIEQIKDIKMVAESMLRDKKRSILQQVFTRRTECQTWEEAFDKYTIHAEKIEDFLDSIKVNNRLVPNSFIKFCDEAARQEEVRELQAIVMVNVSEELNENQKKYLAQQKRSFEESLKRGLKKLRHSVEE